jgi:hypothetical protein
MKPRAVENCFCRESMVLSLGLVPLATSSHLKKSIQRVKRIPGFLARANNSNSPGSPR